MQELPVPKAGYISQIVHVSDIHIRTGSQESSRFEEYMCVFKNFLSQVESLDRINETVVVITGDIFHHKRRLEASGIALFNLLMTRLAALVPVFVIQGNHDYQQEFPDEPDLLDQETENLRDFFGQPG